MLNWCCPFGMPSDPLKDTFMLYKTATEQYENPEILKKIRSLIPRDIILKTAIKEDSINIIPLLKWFKNEFMKWTPRILFVKCALTEVIVLAMLVTAVLVIGQQE